MERRLYRVIINPAMIVTWLVMGFSWLGGVVLSVGGCTPSWRCPRHSRAPRMAMVGDFAARPDRKIRKFYHAHVEADHPDDLHRHRLVIVKPFSTSSSVTLSRCGVERFPILAAPTRKQRLRFRSLDWTVPGAGPRTPLTSRLHSRLSPFDALAPPYKTPQVRPMREMKLQDLKTKTPAGAARLRRRASRSRTPAPCASRS